VWMDDGHGTGLDYNFLFISVEALGNHMSFVCFHFPICMEGGG
jgi:hypothetical protein